MDFDIELDSRPEYHRVSLDWKSPESRSYDPQHAGLPVALSTGNQLSSRLLSMHSANALLILPESTSNKRHLKRGDLVDAFVIGQIY